MLLKSFQNSFSYFVLTCLHIAFATFTFSVCWFHYYQYQMPKSWFQSDWRFPILIFLIMCALLDQLYESFRMDLHPDKELVLSQFLASVVPHLCFYLLNVLLYFKFFNIFPFILYVVVNYGFAMLYTGIVLNKYTNPTVPRHGLIIYAKSRNLMDRLADSYLSHEFAVIEKMSINTFKRQTTNPLEGVDTLFLYGISGKNRELIMHYCITNDIRIYTIPDVSDLLMMSGTNANLVHLPILEVHRYDPNQLYLFIKRAFDIFVSLLGLLILWPFMLITAIAVKSDGGPAIYRQTRLTKDGKKFDILKFRSMRVDAEKDGVARLSTGDKDNRITNVGKVIRAIRFDELPQLFNILKGDMTIVGPRPERPEIAEEYYTFLPEFELRLQAKAGLTGYAQVYGQYNTTPEDKLLFDLMYIAHPSIWNDLKIMFATIKVIFMKDSTEGIAEGKTTAKS